MQYFKNHLWFPNYTMLIIHPSLCVFFYIKETFKQLYTHRPSNIDILEIQFQSIIQVILLKSNIHQESIHSSLKRLRVILIHQEIHAFPLLHNVKRFHYIHILLKWYLILNYFQESTHAWVLTLILLESFYAFMEED